MCFSIFPNALPFYCGGGRHHANAVLDAVHYPRRLQLHALAALEDAEMLRSAAEGVVVPDEGGKTALQCMDNKKLAVIRHVFVDKLCLAALLTVGDSPLAYHHAEPLIAPGFHHLVEKFHYGLLVAFGLGFIGGGEKVVAPEIVFAGSGVVPRRVIVELHAHVVVAVALDVLGHDEIAVV